MSECLILNFPDVEPLPKSRKRLQDLLSKCVGKLVVVESPKGYFIGKLESFDAETFSLVVSWNGKLKIVKYPRFLKVLPDGFL
ncbi:MAG: hypothetical protein QXT10_02150 [Candidatus Bathyarchaeia archaeon]